MCGEIEPEGEPFDSPVRNKAAVLYHFSVYHMESRPNSNARSEVVDFAGYGAMPFRVGGVSLGSFPTLYDFDVRGIDRDDSRERMKDFLRFARLEGKERGKIEWIQIPEPDMWDGRSRVTRTFTRGESRPVEQWRFNETVVAPGDKACAIGVWSASRNALMDPWLYRGTRETVKEILGTSVGCGRVLGFLLIVGAIALAAYFAGLF